MFNVVGTIDPEKSVFRSSHNLTFLLILILLWISVGEIGAQENLDKDITRYKSSKKAGNCLCPKGNAQ